jgi:aminoglycoside phosphotransferase (APT) family kinase protein
MITENESSPKEIESAKEMARLVIAHHFGNKKPRRIAHKASGLSNFVFAVNHSEGNFIVRLSFDPARINLFIKEQWAQERAREAGVPVAEVLEVGNEIIGHPFMISRTVAGLEATFHPNQAEILQAMGRFAALINTIPTNGFGNTFDWSSNQLSRNETWRDYLEKELNYELKLQILEKRRVLTEKQIKQLNKILADSMKTDRKPALNHGDVRLKNVIVSETGEIQALLDWEHCKSNLAPEWELSLALHDLSIDGKQFFLEGYGLGEKILREIAPLVKAINLINYAPVIEQFAIEKNTVRLEQYRTRLSGALDLYSL